MPASTNNRQIQDEFILTMGQIAEFWGFNKTMGQIYGFLYTQELPQTMQQIIEGLSLSKSYTSTSLKDLQRWGMIEKCSALGQRAVRYEAENNILSIIYKVMSTRKDNEFDKLLSKIGDLSSKVKPVKKNKEFSYLAKQIEKMNKSFKSLDRYVFGFLKLFGFAKG